MQKQVILTGIRANNDLHIGNYFGALLPIIDMAKSRSDDYQINLFVPDLHSFTTPIDHSKLYGQIMHNLKLFVAGGLPLDSPSIHIYRQSYVPAHSEMTWILDCFTGFGEMSRMTQFKDKSALSSDEKKKVIQNLSDSVFQAANEGVALPDTPVRTVNKYFRQIVEQVENSRASRTSVGLFNYPVLMAADILLYGARYVPVGDDQTQHLEFTRDIAERMNGKFGELFVVPEPVAKQHEFFGKDQGLRIKDLADPSKKMSKSDASDKGVIFLGDDPDEAARKVMSATTDSFTDGIKFNPTERPGVANLLQIYDLLKPGNRDKMLALSNYKELKETVALAIKDFLVDFQAKLADVDEEAIVHKLEADEAAMNNVANQTLLKVQQSVGLRAKP